MLMYMHTAVTITCRNRESTANKKCPSRKGAGSQTKNNKQTRGHSYKTTNQGNC